MSGAACILFDFERTRDDLAAGVLGRFSRLEGDCEALLGLPAAQLQADAAAFFGRLGEGDRGACLGALERSSVEGSAWQVDLCWPESIDASPAVRWIGLTATPEFLPGGGQRWRGHVVDVTERREAYAALEKSEHSFRQLTKLSSDWYWQIDEQFRFRAFAGYREEKSGMSQDQNVGKTRWELGALNMSDADWERHRETLRQHQPFTDLELARKDREGNIYWVSISGQPIYDASGRFAGYQGIGRNITERKLAEAEVERMAYYDDLTGLPNRRLLSERMQEIRPAQTDGRVWGALLFIDLDNFKDLNDTRGHVVGDALLQKVALRLKSCVKAGDTVARFGGDEFIVMLSEISPQRTQAIEEVEAAAQRMTHQLNQPYDLFGEYHHSSPSIGITILSDAETPIETLMQQADLAMYEAKNAGRNTWRFFDPMMQTEVLERSAIEADLRQAIARDELAVVYQPQVDATGRLQGAEALLRWRHPKRGMVSPALFIPLAEQSDLILSLGQWVLVRACEQLATWATEPATAHLELAVNVSARQFRHPDFVGMVQEALRETGAPTGRLKLELTESLLLEDVDGVVERMQALKAQGLKFSLDDFGTGYSSLSYLKRLPLDQIKIDQAFVRDLLTDRYDTAIVRTIVALGHSLGLVLVAEGVKLQSQVDFLRGLGCQLYQGEFYGQPAPVSDLLLRI